MLQGAEGIQKIVLEKLNIRHDGSAPKAIEGEEIEGDAVMGLNP